MVLLLATLFGTLPRAVTSADFSVLRAIRKMFLILVFFALILMSALATGYTWESANRVQEFMVVILTCFMLLFWAASDFRIWGCLGALVAAGLPLSRDALTRSTWMHETIGAQAYQRMDMNRLNSNFGSPNYIALLMAVLSLICLNFFWTRLPKAPYLKVLKLGALGLLGIFVFIFLRANSRGASLGFAAGLLVYWLLQKRKLVTAVILVTLVGAVLAFGPQAYFDRLKTIVAYQNDASATDRLELWNIGFGLIRDHPLFGVGPDNFVRYAFNSPHNAYIQAAAEYGIPAAIVYCAILISGFFSSISAILMCKRFPDSNDLRAAAVAVTCVIAEITVQGFTTGFAHREFVYIFVTFAYATRLTAQRRLADVSPATTGPISMWMAPQGREVRWPAGHRP
jgi:O-antigen ligase